MASTAKYSNDGIGININKIGDIKTKLNDFTAQIGNTANSTFSIGPNIKHFQNAVKGSKATDEYKKMVTRVNTAIKELASVLKKHGQELDSITAAYKKSDKSPNVFSGTTFKNS